MRNSILLSPLMILQMIRFLLCIIIVSACTTAKPGSETTSPDSLVAEIKQKEVPEILDDSLNYIGFIERFDKSDVFYVSLNFRNDFNYNDYEKVEKLADSVVFKNTGENTAILSRRKIPLDKAQKYFDLRGLDKINIISKNHEVIATGEFVRIEYLETTIESGFIAIFKMDNTNLTDQEFCIGNSFKKIENTRYSAFNNKPLTTSITRELEKGYKLVYNVDHYRSADSLDIYSIASVDTTAFIFDSSDKNLKVLYKSEWNEMISSIVILPKEVNGRPVLLADCGRNATDWTWTSLLVYNGREYKRIPDQRIKW
jgi:hypothetical protein